MDSKPNILYELVCHAEWIEDKEELTPFPSLSTCKSGLLSYLNPASYIRKKPLTPAETALWLKSVGPTWHFALTSDGKIMAILQDSLLETRSSRDNFCSILGKTHVMKDPFPNFRRMAWTKDSSLLAVSLTNGCIVCFDIMASQMFSVRRYETVSENGEKLPFSIDQALVGMFFVEERLKKTTYYSELVTIDKRGIVKSFRQINPDELQFHHEGSLRQYYPCGISDAQYSENQGIILVAGHIIQESDSELPNMRHGITAWRLLLDHPYYRILYAVDRGDFRLDARRLWKIAFTFSSGKSQHQESVTKLSICPSGNCMAAIHVSGTISFWHLPSLKLKFTWPLKYQFHYRIGNTRFNYRWRNYFNQSQNRMLDPLIFHPYDINWWDDESVIISRVNGSVTVVPVSEHSTRNLLGDFPELFESPVRLSSRFGKNFFVLESEVRPKRNIANSEAASSWIKSGIQEILFWMTDIERFRPPRKRKKVLPCWIHSNRIFAVRNITPQELFHRKIEQEEYGDALDLANAYNLDPDLVYQRQWTKNPVTLRSIKEYLGKISKRNWVLQECLDRVPDTIDTARELLDFGLKGTDITAAVLVSQGNDNGKFSTWKPADLELVREEYMSLVDVKNPEVLRLLRYRKRFLHFIDILDTYEEMLGGPRFVEERYDSKSYGALRSRNTIESAIEMAQNCDICGLKVLLTNHWSDLSAQYLEIISSFPETKSPHEYKEFLPKVSTNGKVILWSKIARKAVDWCEAFLVKADNPNCNSPSGLEIKIGDVYKWYEKRIREIESLSGITNHALDLGLLGIERNVLDLRNLVQELQILEILVYEVQLEDMTLTQLSTKTDIEKISLLLSKSTEETLVSDFRYYVLPFILNCEDREEGASFKLLNEYITSICSTDLSFALKIFEASHQDEYDPLIPNAKDLMLLAYNCIYKCTNTEQTDNILAILRCLPEKGYIEKSADVEELHILIDDLQTHFHVFQLLQKYQVALTMENIKIISETRNDASIEDLFVNVCRSASKMLPALKLMDWKILLTDMLEIRKRLFKNFDVEKCFEIYVLAILKSGSSEVIKLAKDFLEKSPPAATKSRGKSDRHSPEYSPAFSLFVHVIPYSKAVDMIIDAAELYFDASSSHADPDMGLCRVCLGLIENPKEPRVAYMFDLLEAVKLMNKDFRLAILPRAARIYPDKVSLIRQAMKNTTDGYKKIQQLLKLMILLHIDGMSLEEGECIVLEMTGDAALDHGDIKLGIQICQNIMAKGYNAGWKIFTTLAEVQSEPSLLDLPLRASFINYALSICPDSEILTVLSTIKCIQCHVYHDPICNHN